MKKSKVTVELTDYEARAAWIFLNNSNPKEKAGTIYRVARKVQHALVKAELRRKETDNG